MSRTVAQTKKLARHRMRVTQCYFDQSCKRLDHFQSHVEKTCLSLSDTDIRQSKAKSRMYRDASLLLC